MNRRRLLALLLALLAAAVAYAFWASPRPEREIFPETRTRQERGRGPAANGQPADGETVRLDLLRREPEEFPGAEKDLFAPLYRVKPPSSPPPPPPRPMVEGPPAQAFSPLPEPPPAPLPRFSFRGFLQREGEKTVFLALGDDLFVVKGGARFGKNEEFQIVEFTDLRLVIRQSGDPRPISVSLRESGDAGGVGSMGRPGAPVSPTGFRNSSGFIPGPRPELPHSEPDGEIPAASESEPEPKQNPFVSPGQLGTPGLLRPLGADDGDAEMARSMQEPTRPEEGYLPAQEDFQ